MKTKKDAEFFIKKPDGTYKKLGKISDVSITDTSAVPDHVEDPRTLSAFGGKFTAECTVDLEVREYRGKLFTMKQIVFPGASAGLYIGDELLRVYFADRILTEKEMRDMVIWLEGKVAAELEKEMKKEWKK